MVSRRNKTWKGRESTQGETVSRVDGGMKIQGKRKMVENLIHFKCEKTESQKEVRQLAPVHPLS